MHSQPIFLRFQREKEPHEVIEEEKPAEILEEPRKVNQSVIINKSKVDLNCSKISIGDNHSSKVLDDASDTSSVREKKKAKMSVQRDKRKGKMWVQRKEKPDPNTLMPPISLGTPTIRRKVKARPRNFKSGVNSVANQSMEQDPTSPFNKYASPLTKFENGSTFEQESFALIKIDEQDNEHENNIEKAFSSNDSPIIKIEENYTPYNNYDKSKFSSNPSAKSTASPQPRKVTKMGVNFDLDPIVERDSKRRRTGDSQIDMEDCKIFEGDLSSIHGSVLDCSGFGKAISRADKDSPQDHNKQKFQDQQMHQVRLERQESGRQPTLHKNKQSIMDINNTVESGINYFLEQDFKDPLITKQESQTEYISRVSQAFDKVDVKLANSKFESKTQVKEFNSDQRKQSSDQRSEDRYSDIGTPNFKEGDKLLDSNSAKYRGMFNTKQTSSKELAEASSSNSQDSSHQQIKSTISMKDLQPGSETKLKLRSDKIDSDIQELKTALRENDKQQNSHQKQKSVAFNKNPLSPSSKDQKQAQAKTASETIRTSEAKKQTEEVQQKVIQKDLTYQNQKPVQSSDMKSKLKSPTKIERKPQTHQNTPKKVLESKGSSEEESDLFENLERIVEIDNQKSSKDFQISTFSNKQNTQQTQNNGMQQVKTTSMLQHAKTMKANTDDLTLSVQNTRTSEVTVKKEKQVVRVILDDSDEEEEEEQTNLQNTSAYKSKQKQFTNSRNVANYTSQIPKLKLDQMHAHTTKGSNTTKGGKKSMFSTYINDYEFEDEVSQIANKPKTSVGVPGEKTGRMTAGRLAYGRATPNGTQQNTYLNANVPYQGGIKKEVMLLAKPMRAMKPAGVTDLHKGAGLW